MIIVSCVRAVPGLFAWGEVYEAREILPFSGMLNVLGEQGIAALVPATHFRPIDDEGEIVASPELIAAFEVAVLTGVGQ